jgi:ribonuclease-3
VEKPIVAAFRGQIEYAATHSVDYKTELQEELARIRKQVVYAVLETEGPAHDRRFTCAALIDGEQRGIGIGSTKKEAEQEAARQALESLAGETPA